MTTSKTDDDHVQQYLNRVEARRSENTLKNRKVAVRQWLKFLTEQDKTLADAEPWNIEDWMDNMLLDDYAPRSVRTKVYTISDLYQFLDRRDIAENPIPEPENDIDGLDELKGNKIDNYTDVRYLTGEEHQKMVNHAKNLRNRLLLQLLWNTGVRAQEAIDVRINDIDRENREIEIQNAKTARHSTDTTRTTYYRQSLATPLKQWLDRGGRTAYLGVCGEEDDGHLLVTKQQPRMAIGRVNEIVDETAERAGLQENLYEDASGRMRRKITTHAYRHSYAVHRVKNGMPLVYLQSLLNHHDITVTRRYLKFRQDDIAKAERKYSPKP